MENQQNREKSAWATRKAALQSLICNALENMDDSEQDDADCSAGSQPAGSDAKSKIEAAQDNLTTQKVALQDAYKEQQNYADDLQQDKEKLKATKKKYEAIIKRYTERVTSYHEVVSMCFTMMAAPSFIQTGMETQHIFVQTAREALQMSDPISHVQQSLLATAEMTGNKQLALLATSLTGSAGGALDKVITLVKDMIIDLQKQIDLEHKGSWCETQRDQVESAVANADSYVMSLQQTIDSLNSKINSDTERQTNLYAQELSLTSKIQNEDIEMKTTEDAHLAEQQGLRDLMYGMSVMKDNMAASPASTMTQNFITQINGFVSGWETEMTTNDAEHKLYVSEWSTRMKLYKINNARVQAESGFIKEALARYSMSLEENNAAMGEALESQTAAAEMMTTFTTNCETQDGAQIANGASALEKCAMTCQTVNALELACAELSSSDPSQCLLCPADDNGGARTVFKKNIDGAHSFACDTETHSDGSTPDAQAAVCSGIELGDTEECSYTGAAGEPVFHSTVACLFAMNAVKDCDLLPAPSGGCEIGTGVQLDGNLIAGCVTTTIDLSR